jgi:hypothetical protein
MQKVNEIQMPFIVEQFKTTLSQLKIQNIINIISRLAIIY